MQCQEGEKREITQVSAMFLTPNAPIMLFTKQFYSRVFALKGFTMFHLDEWTLVDNKETALISQNSGMEHD